MSNRFIRYFKEEPRVPGKGSFFASLAVNIILLYLVNNLRYMGITQLVEPNLVSCLWSANTFFALIIIGNFVLLLFRPVWFFYLVQMLINAAGVNVFCFIYILYPFNLGSSTLDSIVKIVLILIMVGFFLAFLAELYRFGANVPLPRKKTPPGPPDAPQVDLDAAGDDQAQNPESGSTPAETPPADNPGAENPTGSEGTPQEPH